MTDIKRPNYFTSQFLVEKDFTDEQGYHLGSRRRHNRAFHTVGIAEGLEVTRISGSQVQLSPGTAVDAAGRELVLIEPVTYTLATAGSNVDVYLTIAYQEVLDPADHYVVQEIDNFVRVTERPKLQDGTTPPPTDGSVLVLARVRLNASGVIESSASIDPTVRRIAGARIAPLAVDTTALADAAVTTQKLAPEARPSTIVASNAITVDVDDAQKRITIGENHSARADNPHATTAAQIDAQGGANRLVAQINAGTGVVDRSRVQSSIVSGVVTFESVPFSANEVFCNEIDPGFGAGPVSVEMAIDDATTAGFTLGADVGYVRTVALRTSVDRSTGKFRIFATRMASGTGEGQVKVRWFASRPTAGSDTTSAISVTVTPSTASLLGGQQKSFQATVNNTNAQGVTWKVDGGSIAPVGNLVLFTAPNITGTYTLTATSTLDTAKSGSALISVNADVTVSLDASSATVVGGTPRTFTATVVNTPDTGVTWAASAGSLSATTGKTVSWTAPTAPGAYTVTATSTAKTDKSASCTITVPAVQVALSQTTATVNRGETASFTATVSNAADTSVTWSATGGSFSSTTSNTTTYTAPGSEGSFTVTATSKTDPSRFASCTVTVPPVTIAVTGNLFIAANTSTTLAANITGTSNGNATWSKASSVGSLSPLSGATTTFIPPSNTGGAFDVTATSQADPTKFTTVTVNVQNVATGGGGGGGGTTDSPPLSQFSRIVGSPVVAESPAAASPEPDADAGTAELPARASARPTRRPPHDQAPKAGKPRKPRKPRKRRDG